MKKFILALLLFTGLFATAQIPAQMNYQGIARNSVGNVLPNKKITVRLTVRDQGPTGAGLYTEVRNVTTSSLGLFNIAIGSNGAVSATGSFALVNWSGGIKYLQVEIDPDGGTNYLNLGASPLLSVPYSLYALSANPTGPAGGDLFGTFPNPTIGADAVTTMKLADNAVVTSKIADSSITLAKLAPGVFLGGNGNPTGPAGGELTGNYPNPQIGIGVITNSKLAANSVNTLNLIDASVTSAKLADDAVNTQNILDGSVTAIKLAAGVIPTSLPPSGLAGGDLTGNFPNPNVANNAITTTKIQDASVTLPKLGPDVIAAIANSSNPTGPAGGELTGNYPNPQIGIGVITSSKLAANSVNTIHLIDASVTNAKLADNAVNTSNVIDGSITAIKLAAGVIPSSLPPSGAAGGDLTGNFPNPNVASNAITTAKIANGSVTNAKLATNAVNTPNIVDGSVTAVKLAAGVIPTSLPPSGAAGGDLSGSFPNPNVANNAINTAKLADNSVTTTKIVDASVTNSKLATNSVGTTNIIDGSITSIKLAPGVIPSSLPPSGAAGGDLIGNFPNPNVANNAINTAKLADNSVTTTKILDSNVTSIKLATSAVNTANIANASVTIPKLGPDVIAFMSSGPGGPPTGNAGGDLTGTYPNPLIANGAVTTAKIANNAVTTQQIASGAVTSQELANGAVTANKLANNAVTTSAIANNAVTNTELANNAVNTQNIVNGSVTANKLAPGVIPASLPPSGTAGGDLTGNYPNPTITTNAVTNGKIANLAVTNGKLADNSISTIKIQDASVTLPKLGPDVIAAMGSGGGGNPTGPAGGDLTGTYPNPTVANLAVTNAKLADNSVTTTKIVDGNVTNAKLAANSVGTTNIIDASVTSAKLAAGVIPTSLPPSGTAGGDLVGSYPNPTVANLAVTTAKLADNSVTTTKIVDGNVTNSKLAASAVNTTNIVDGSVTAIKLAPGVIPSALPPTGPAGGDLTGTFPNPTVANLAVTNGKLADNAISTVKIQDASVTLPKLGPDVIAAMGGGGGGNPTGPAGGDLSGSYPNPTVANLAITNAKLATNSVGTTNIIDASVTSAKLAAGVIPTTLPPSGSAGGDLTGSYPNPTVANLAVTTAKLADNSVTTSKMVDGNVTNSKLAINSVGTTNIIDANVTNSKLATNSVATTNIIDANVTNPKLADNAISTAKIQDASVTLPKLGPDVIAAMGGGGGGSPTGPAGGDLAGTYPNPTVANLAVTTAKLADNSVTTSKIVDGNVTNSKLDVNSVGTTNIIDASVTNSKLAVNSVGTTNIIDASVTSAKLAAGVIPTTLPPSGVAGGDLSGSYPSPIVSKLQGVAVNNTAPVSGQVLKFNGSVWTPQNDATGFSLPYAGSDNGAANSFSVTNAGAGGGLEGVNSSTGANTIGVLGRVTSVSAGASSTGVKGMNLSTGTNGYGVWGNHAGYGIGVYGFSVNGNGVQGTSTNSTGVFGTSATAAAGYFDISSTSNTYDAVTAYTVGTGSALVGTSELGNGLWGITYDISSAGVIGYNIGGGEAIVGRNVSSTAAAVVGRNDDVYGGVQGIGGADGATGVLAQANVDGFTGGNALVAEIVGSAAGNPAVFKANGANVARIDKNGKGYFNGGTQVGGADVAEYFDVEGARNSYEPGDVLMISTTSDRTVEKSSGAYSTLVAGVFATKPGLMLTEKNAEQNQLDKMVPMGVIGVIPTKVCLEGGAIKRGDLIVTSSIPGVAMKADLDKVKPGQVIGKALQDYNETTVGKINVLVSIK